MISIGYFRGLTAGANDFSGRASKEETEQRPARTEKGKPGRGMPNFLWGMPGTRRKARNMSAGFADAAPSIPRRAERGDHTGIKRNGVVIPDAFGARAALPLYQAAWRYARSCRCPDTSEYPRKRRRPSWR